jgi:hypothetical protein
LEACPPVFQKRSTLELELAFCDLNLS